MDGLQAENSREQKLRRDVGRGASGLMDCTDKRWTETMSRQIGGTTCLLAAEQRWYGDCAAAGGR